MHPLNPQVLLLLPARCEESAALLKGIVHYQRARRPWMVSLQDEAGADIDLRWVRSRKWSGVISCNTTPELAQLCLKLHLPLVDLSDAPSVPGISKIRPDNVAIGHVGAEYFMERKFKRYAFCGFDNQRWSKERRDGFVEALELAGHRCDIFDVEQPVDFSPSWDAKQTTFLAAWLRSLPDETAIMACNDLRAHQVVRAARLAGLQIPAQVAVLGVNNDAMRCELADPSISSVVIDGFEAGRQAAEHLEQLLEVEKKSVIDLRIEPGGVITRKSTDVLALRDKNVATALNYIREHACKGITVDQVLSHAFMSRSQLENKFRRYLGRSPQVEIRQAQVAKISQLLSETNLPLKEIAEQTGFVHVEYMCVVFKRITGDTPGRYRNRNCQTPANACAVA